MAQSRKSGSYGDPIALDLGSWSSKKIKKLKRELGARKVRRSKGESLQEQIQRELGAALAEQGYGSGDKVVPVLLLYRRKRKKAKKKKGLFPFFPPFPV